MAHVGSISGTSMSLCSPKAIEAIHAEITFAALKQNADFKERTTIWRCVFEGQRPRRRYLREHSMVLAESSHPDRALTPNCQDPFSRKPFGELQNPGWDKKLVAAPSIDLHPPSSPGLAGQSSPRPRNPKNEKKEEGLLGIPRQ